MPCVIKIKTEVEFKIIPFTEEELSHKFEYNEFVERGYPMAVLSIIDENFFLNSKTNYKFGVLDNDGNYYWFFYGKVVAKNRLDALKYYNALLTYCKNNSLGKPFAFKDF